jgi:hypothetical protein
MNSSPGRCKTVVGYTQEEERIRYIFSSQTTHNEAIRITGKDCATGTCNREGA